MAAAGVIANEALHLSPLNLAILVATSCLFALPTVTEQH